MHKHAHPRHRKAHAPHPFTYVHMATHAWASTRTDTSTHLLVHTLAHACKLYATCTHSTESQPCPGCITRSVASRLTGGDSPPLLHSDETLLKLCIWHWDPQHKEDMDLLEWDLRRPQKWSEGWNPSARRKAERVGVVQPGEEKAPQGDLIVAFQ